jgi:methylaspartate mutase epsilon subunit
MRGNEDFEQLTAGQLFSRFMARAKAEDRVVVQPRMGFASPEKMKMGLARTKSSGTDCIGTITLDAYTRTGDYESPLVCLARGEDLNGYPIVSHPVETTRNVLDGVLDASFPVQVRHGTPNPYRLFQRMLELGLNATEGGPVSYALPYGRVSLEEAVPAWKAACRLLAEESDSPHMESFGGCLLGQLCPPSMLIAMTLLECLFFRENGIRSVSLSFSQGPSFVQDLAALRALRELAERHLSGMQWHIVVYNYMGFFPRTENGAEMLIRDSAVLTREARCGRLIVKTKAEGHGIPSIEENVEALQLASAAIRSAPRPQVCAADEQSCHEEIKSEVEALLEATLNLSPEIGDALLRAFRVGILDVPYCLHSNNLRRAQAFIDREGMLRWHSLGNLPLPKTAHRQEGLRTEPTSAELLRQLRYVADRYDGAVRREYP